MKNKKNISKYSLIAISSLSFLATPQVVISCSKNSNETTSNINLQDVADKQYNAFYKAIENSKVKGNLFFENFDFVNKNKLTLDEISAFISLGKLNDSFIYEFVVSKEDNSSVLIAMNVTDRNNNKYEPTESEHKTKKLNNVKNLPQQNKEQISNLYNKWKNEGLNSINIKNQNNQVIDKSQYSQILPSYVFATNCKFEYLNNFDNPNIKISTNYDDEIGTISFKLGVQDQESKLYFYIDNIKELETIKQEGFATFKQRNDEIIDIYKVISGTFDLESLTNNKLVPFIASGITTIEKIKQIFTTTQGITVNEKVTKFLEIINNNNSWYTFAITTSANDEIGSLTITWKIIDKATGYEIVPQNLNKSTTINSFIKLVKKQNDVVDETLLSDGYKAYQVLSQLYLNQSNELRQKASQVDISTLTTDWIFNNTNITTLSGLSSQPVKEGEFITFKINTNTFRFKIDTNWTSKETKTNDALGVIYLPFIMQIKIDGEFINSKSEFIDFLPPNGKTSEDKFNTSTREATLNIGGYLTDDIESVKIIYDYLNANNKITISLGNKNIYDTVLNNCNMNQSLVQSELEAEIKSTLISLVSRQNPGKEDIIENMINSAYKPIFELKEIPVIKTNDSFSTNSVKFKLVANNDAENENIVDIPYVVNGVIQNFPSVSIEVRI